MVIDCHTHIGKILQFDLRVETLIESMEKYGIDFSLVSSIEGAEFDHERNSIPLDIQRNQISLNKELIRIVRLHKDKLGAQIWVKPHNEKIDQEFEEMIKNNIDIIYAIKFHPYHSQTNFDDERSLQYVDLAKKYGLPVVVHTADSYESSPMLVYKVAKKYPDVKFVMFHLGLGTDNLEAIDLVSSLPNLYGDTSWVTAEKARIAIKKCGANKIMFGTDNPIDGVDTLGRDDFYQAYFKDMKDLVSIQEYECLMHDNAKTVFNIKRGGSS